MGNAATDTFVCMGFLAVCAVVVVAVIGGGAYLIYYLIALTRKQCPNLRCGARGSLRKVRSVVKSRTKMYGLVTRYGHSSGTAYMPGRGSVPGHSTQTWQERVPIIRTVYSNTYRCSECGRDDVREEVVDEEDFSQP